MRRWIVVLASGSILLAIGAQPANPDGLAIVCPAEISEDGRTVVTNLFFNDFVVSELGYYYFDAVYGYDKLDGAGCFGDDSFVVQWGGLLDFAEPVAGQFTAIAKQYAFACAFPELAGCLGPLAHGGVQRGRLVRGSVPAAAVEVAGGPMPHILTGIAVQPLLLAQHLERAGA